VIVPLGNEVDGLDEDTFTVTVIDPPAVGVVVEGMTVAVVGLFETVRAVAAEVDVA
jgi:hypothetical protein